MTLATSKLCLTADHVARVQRLEPDEGPRPHLAQMCDADYDQHTEQFMREKGTGPLSIFAYGSLIWKPEFEFVHSSPGTAHGWHRSFCMKIERWRGTRALPGLMMALDRGGSCKGMLYQLPDHGLEAHVQKLLRREMTNKPATNMPRWLRVKSQGQNIRALAFVANPQGHSYVGKKPLAEVAHTLARAAGHWGSGAEYLFNTVSHLEQLGLHDRNLWQLQKLVAEEIDRFPA